MMTDELPVHPAGCDCGLCPRGPLTVEHVAEGADVGEYCQVVLCAKTYRIDEQFAICTKEAGHDGVHEGGDGEHRYLWSNREKFYSPEYLDDRDERMATDDYPDWG